jgi:hypothetical protein
VFGKQSSLFSTVVYLGAAASGWGFGLRICQATVEAGCPSLTLRAEHSHSPPAAGFLTTRLVREEELGICVYRILSAFTQASQ